MKPAFVAFPGALFSSKAHYVVFLRGNTPLTARLLKPVLIDARPERSPTAGTCLGTSRRC